MSRSPITPEFKIQLCDGAAVVHYPQIVGAYQHPQPVALRQLEIVHPASAASREGFLIDSSRIEWICREASLRSFQEE